MLRGPKWSLRYASRLTQRQAVCEVRMMPNSPERISSSRSCYASIHQDKLLSIRSSPDVSPSRLTPLSERQLQREMRNRRLRRFHVDVTETILRNPPKVAAS